MSFKLMALALLSLAVILVSSVSKADPVTVEVSDVRSEADRRTGRPLLSMKIKTPPSLQLYELTSSRHDNRVTSTLSSKYVGKKMVLRLNGVIFYSGVIREPLIGSLAISDNNWTAQDTKNLADRLSMPGAHVVLEIEAE